MVIKVIVSPLEFPEKKKLGYFFASIKNVLY